MRPAFVLILLALTGCYGAAHYQPPFSTPYTVRNQWSAIAIADERCGDWDEHTRGKWRASYASQAWYVWYDVGEPNYAFIDVAIDARTGMTLFPCTMHDLDESRSVRSLHLQLPHAG